MTCNKHFHLQVNAKKNFSGEGILSSSFVRYMSSVVKILVRIDIEVKFIENRKLSIPFSGDGYGRIPS